MKKLLVDDIYEWVMTALENRMSEEDIMAKLKDVDFLKFQVECNFWDELALEKYIASTVGELILKGDVVR